MAHQTFTIEEVAEYLHLTPEDIERLIENEEIPVEERGDRVVFRKQDIDAWASQRILGMQDRGLVDYHQKTSRGTRQVFENEAIMPELIRSGYIEPALGAKTKASVLREMVALADRTGRLNQSRDLLDSLEAREALCSTALPEGLALLHPRHHDPYMFDSSFIVLGRPVQEIHFGAPDGRPTTLFFLVCCQDDRIHLHALARLCLMAQKTTLLAELHAAPDAASMHAHILAAEAQVLGARKPPAA
jgi:excisionase family DNA binding protein